MKKLRFLAPAATLLAVFACSPVEAGWGSRGYHSGGSSGYVYASGGSYGSSGGSYGSSGGSYGSYGSSGGSSGGYSSYRSHGSHGRSGGGLLARLHAKIHHHIAAKRARHARHGYASYTSHGSSGYSSYGSRGYAGYGSSSHGSSGYSSYRSYRHYSYASGGSSGGHSSGSAYSYSAPLVYQSHGVAPVVNGGYDSGAILDQPYSEGDILDGGQTAPQTPSQAAPQTPPADPSAPGAPEAGAPAEARLQADAALITVAVPPTARVTVNGHPTTSEGPIRQFMSRGLKAGYTYAYEIVVEDEGNGQASRETKTLRVRAGDKERIVFAAPQAESVATALTVHVPDDAKVTLAGNATAAEGQTRVFRTSQLRKGEVWDGYEIAVTVVRDGREVTKKKTLRLVAGSDQELAFDFAGEAASAKLAAR